MIVGFICRRGILSSEKINIIFLICFGFIEHVQSTIQSQFESDNHQKSQEEEGEENCEILPPPSLQINVPSDLFFNNKNNQESMEVIFEIMSCDNVKGGYLSYSTLVDESLPIY